MLSLNGHPLNFTLYPNNETVLLDIIFPYTTTRGNIIEMKYACDLDLTRLMMVKRWIDGLVGGDIELVMRYVPYSRMDRSQDDSSFSLKYLCEFINFLGFSKVYISEAHSPVTVEMLDNVVHYEDSSVEISQEAMSKLGFGDGDYVLFPDKGAFGRYGNTFRNSLLGILIAEKVRDFQTGEITGLNILGDEELRGGRVMIIDDLCSRGGSFYYSALELKSMGAGDISLTVTHCEDTIFEGQLLKGNQIKYIFTTDSILTRPHDKITLISPQ